MTLKSVQTLEMIVYMWQHRKAIDDHETMYISIVNAHINKNSIHLINKVPWCS